MTALVYFADATNPEYLGPASMKAIAGQCAKATDPSGRNDEYVFELERWLLEQEAGDAHVFAVARALRAHQHSERLHPESG